MNILEKFIRTQTKTNYEFAKITGKKTQTIDAQIKVDRTKNTSNSITHLIKYMLFFKVNEFEGIYNSKKIKITVF